MVLMNLVGGKEWRQIQRMDLWTQLGKERVGWTEKVAQIYIYTGAQPFSCVWLFATPQTVARQAPLSMGFPRQECWSGLSFPSPEDFPNPGIWPTSPALQVNSLLLSHQGKPLFLFISFNWTIYKDVIPFTEISLNYGAILLTASLCGSTLRWASVSWPVDQMLALTVLKPVIFMENLFITMFQSLLSCNGNDKV